MKVVETASNNGEPIERLQPSEYAYHFMKKREGLRLQAYHDWGRQWSIGYGTNSYPWESITEQEAIKRYKEAIQPRATKVQSDYPNLNSCQKGALISFLYNCPSCYRNLQSYWISKDLRLRHSSVCVDGICKKRKWLYKRRIAERELYNTCNND